MLVPIAAIVALVLALLLVAIILSRRLRHRRGSGKHQQCATNYPQTPLLVHDSSPLGMGENREAALAGMRSENSEGLAISRDRQSCQHYPC